MPELIISPRALLADVKQFEPEDKHASSSLEDPCVELLRRGATLQQDDFIACKSSATKHFPAPSQKAFSFRCSRSALPQST